MNTKGLRGRLALLLLLLSVLLLLLLDELTV
jgi:hypothetical protein